MEEHSEQRRFSHEEVGELIETATRLEQLRHEGEGIGVDELREVAVELGISEEALGRALDERERQRVAEQTAQEVAAANRSQQADAAEQRMRKRRKALNEWKSHAASYVGVIGGLAVIDLLTSDGLDWVYYPAAGWGIGFLVHTFSVLFRVED